MGKCRCLVGGRARGVVVVTFVKVDFVLLFARRHGRRRVGSNRRLR